MKKDVIYIDVEDDITAIIGKVKLAGAKIVALVPPKRSGVLQSVVNLKLLKKNAADSGKQVVLITSDHSLLSLASGVKIPVAKNLQSRPELAPIPVLEVDNDDIINGSELPVGELANALGETALPGEVGPSVADELSQKIDLRDMPPETPAVNTKLPKTATGKKVKVPDFMAFRKWLFLGILGLILLIGLWFWAFKIAPRASVTITAKTSAVPIEASLNLNPKISASDIGKLQLKPVVQQIKKSVSTEFDATGTKDTGNKATGTVSMSYTFDSNSVTIPAGTVFTAASGQKFTSVTAATIPGASVSGGGVKPGTATVQVQGLDIGPEYNIPAQSYTVTGYSSVAASGAATVGGTREKVNVVTQDDINKAKDSLSPPDTNAVKNDLRKQFSGDAQVIEESFTADTSDPTPSPNVGDTAKRGKLTLETTYTLIGLQRTDIKQVLAASLKDTLSNKPNQSTISDGSDNVQFKLFQKVNDGAFTVSMTTTGYIGTTINASDITKQIMGKHYGDIEQITNQIPGVNKVDIKFSPFWVNQVPTDPKKIDVKLSVQ